MCARCMLLWEVEELKERLEEIGKSLGCWFYVDVTDDLKVLWRAYKDIGANGDSVELLSNGDIGCNLTDFEEDVDKMPEVMQKILQRRFGC